MDIGARSDSDVIRITSIGHLMISYEVTLQAEVRLAASVEEFMTESHIPEIFATGCFREIRFSRASAGRFRTAYQASTQADLDRYVQDHVPRFRAEFLERFPDGVNITRETWAQRKVWR
jgi:hypothetical protein